MKDSGTTCQFNRFGLQLGDEPLHLDFWWRCDRWDHSKAALLLNGLDPDGTRLNPDGHLLAGHLQTLAGTSHVFDPDQPASLPTVWTEEITQIVLKQLEVRDEARVDWQALSELVHQCHRLLQHSDLPALSPPRTYVDWAVVKEMTVPWLAWAQAKGWLTALKNTQPNQSPVNQPPKQWWHEGIHEMATNIGLRMRDSGKNPTKVAIAKDIHQRLEHMELSRGKDRHVPDAGTIRKHLNNWHLPRKP